MSVFWTLAFGIWFAILGGVMVHVHVKIQYYRRTGKWLNEMARISQEPDVDHDTLARVMFAYVKHLEVEDEWPASQ